MSGQRKIESWVTEISSRLGITHAAFFLGVIAAIATREISIALVSYFGLVLAAHVCIALVDSRSKRQELQSRISAVEADMALLRTELSKFNLVFGMSQRTPRERQDSGIAEALGRAASALRGS